VHPKAQDCSEEVVGTQSIALVSAIQTQTATVAFWKLGSGT
jgi:hypothetical protein